LVFMTVRDSVLGSNYSVDVVGNDTGGFKMAASLAAGFVVGPTLATGKFLTSSTAQNRSQQPIIFADAGGYYGTYVGGVVNTTGYIGLRFDGDTGTIGTQYAWAKIKVESSTTRVAVTVLEWAYDNCGNPIQVGATTGGSSCGGSENNNSVDSPSTPLLSLLGLGAMGVTSYRRRREAGLKRLAEAQGDVAA